VALAIGIHYLLIWLAKKNVVVETIGFNKNKTKVYDGWTCAKPTKGWKKITSGASLFIYDLRPK